MPSWSSLPLRLRLYISTVVVAAIPIFFAAFRTVLLNGEIYDQNWLILTGITLVTVPVFVLLPSVRSLVTIGDAFIIYICIRDGTEQAILSNAVYMTLLTLVLRGKHRTPHFRVIFNIASAVLTVSFYGHVYRLLLGSGTSPQDLESIILPTFGLALAYFLSNSLLVAAAIALSSANNLFAVWYRNYLSVSLDFLVSACGAGLMVYLSSFHVYLPVLVAPFVGAVWGINKVNRAKAIEAERHLNEQEQLYVRTVEAFALAVDAKDQTTYGHIRRVRAYALGLAKLSGITDKNELMAIQTGSLLHDIGKLAIDDYILNKPGRLTKQEFEKMKIHSTAGDEILREIQFPFPVADYVRSHHERWDGLGYPDGLKGNAIPLGARILTIADAFDAIRSSRPYKESFSIHDSVELLKAQSGTLYDPALVNLFVSNITELEATASQAGNNMPKLSFRKFEKVDQAIQVPSQDTEVPSKDVSSELIALFEFCSTFGKLLQLTDVLPIVSRRLRSIVPFDTCAVYLNTGDDSIRVAYADGNSACLLKDRTMGLGKGVSGWVAAYKRPIFNTKPNLELGDIPHNHQDILSVPLILDSNCLGTITLFDNCAGTYAESHVALLQLAATQVALLIDHLIQNESDRRGDPGIDSLTQTYTASYLSVAAPTLISSSAKNQSPLSLVFLKIDNLNQITNLYGVDAGRSVLKKVADILRNELRVTDILVRYGHESFVALLPGVRAEQAARYCQRLHSQIKTTMVATPLGHNLFVRSAEAISSYPNDGSTIMVLLQNAQSALRQFPSESEPHILEFPPRSKE